MEKLPELLEPTQEQPVQYEQATYTPEVTPNSVESDNPIVTPAPPTLDTPATQPETPTYQATTAISLSEAPVDEAGLENLAAALAHKRAA